MNLKVNLVVLVLALTGFIAINSQRHQRKNDRIMHNRLTTTTTKQPIKKSEKNSQPTTSVMKFTTTIAPDLQLNSNKISNKLIDFSSALELDESTELRDRPVKHKKRWNRAMMALLLAYKLKFAALVPTIIGGLMLLLSTTALAGFFFALFAAILGLKGS